MNNHWSLQEHSYVRMCNTVRLDAGDSVLFDEGTDQVIVAQGNKLKLFPFKGDAPKPTIPANLTIKEGDVCGARLSLDGKFLGIRRSVHAVEIICLTTHESLTIGPKKRQNSLVLDFFWTGMETNDLVLATSSGLEFLKVKSGISSTSNESGVRARVTDSIKSSKIVWVRHVPRDRLLILGGGVQANMLHVFHLTTTNIVKYPKFELDVAHKNTLLSHKTVHPCWLYGILYCLHADISINKLVVYRMYKDLVVRMGLDIPLYSNAIALSVIDNIILVHNLDTKLSLAYDIKISHFPFIDPLPMSLAPPPPSHSSTAALYRSQFGDGNGFQVLEGGETTDSTTAHSQPDVLSETNKQSPQNFVELYKPEWRFFAPNTVIDVGERFGWKLVLDLDEIASSCVDPIQLILFLMNRVGAKSLVVSVLHRLVGAQSTQLAQIREAFNAVNTAYVNALKARQQQQQQGLTTSSPASTPQDSIQFQPPTQQSVVDQGDIFTHVIMPHLSNKPDLKVRERILDCVQTLIVSLQSHLIQVSPSLFELLISLMQSCKKLHNLDLCIRFSVLEDSAQVAQQLAQLHGEYAPALTLALDMLHRLHHSDLLIALLLQHGKVLSACQFVRKTRAISCDPKPFLAAAWECGDKHVFFTVFTFFAQRNWVVRGSTEFTEKEDCDIFVQRFRATFGNKPKAQEDLF